MSIQVITNAKLYVDQFDLSGRTNKLGLSYGASAEDATAFTHDTENFLPGTKRLKLAHEVLYEAGTGLIDEVLFNRVTATAVVHTIGPLTGAESEVGFFQLITAGSYKPGFVQGKVGRASYDAEADDRLIRGLIGANRTTGSSGNGPVLTLAGPTAAQSVYAALHVLAMSGTGSPSLAVTIQSAATVGFGSPTTRITLPTQTALGAVWATPLGPGAITDGFWRVGYTITGTGPSFTFVVVLGIQ